MIASLRPVFLMGTVLVLTSIAGAVSAHAGPCITATACTEWVKLGTGPDRSLVYRTYPLDARNERVTRALVVVHGAGRNADGYFRTAVAAAFLAGALVPLCGHNARCMFTAELALPILFPKP